MQVSSLYQLSAFSRIRRWASAGDQWNWFWLSILTLLIATAGCRQSTSNSADQNDHGKSQKQLQQSNDQYFVGIIDGPSMAPTFKGRHFNASCSECGSQFCFDAKLSISEKNIFCPLCGHAFVREYNARLMPAEKLKFRRPDSVTSLSRWNIVAFRARDHLAIKRIVGLPGERVTIDQGDVVINGRISAKPVPIQMATRILVFDADHGLDRHWVANPMGKARFPFQLSQGRSLKYVNFANYDSFEGQVREPIKDFYGYNQGFSRSLNVCHDLGCEFTIDRIDRPSEAIALQLTVNTSLYGLVRFDFKIENQMFSTSVTQNKTGLASRSQPLADGTQKLTLYASILDGRACVYSAGCGVNDADRLVRLPAEQQEAATAEPILLVCQSDCSAVLSEFRIYRDIHYFEKVSSGERKLDNNEYFVVGDNVPVSKDSRSAGVCPVRSEIVGVADDAMENSDVNHH